jgi:hypothetical protein
MLDRVSEYMADKISEQMPWGALEESNFVQFVHGTARQSQNGDFFYVWDNPMLVSPVSFEKNDVPSVRRCKNSSNI